MDMQYAYQTIKQGGIVIFPTDTVYGIGCDPYNKNSVSLLYKIKKREKTKPFPVLGYSKKELEKSGRYKKKIVTPIIKATEFYPAEDYHQDFYKKSSFRYKTYRFGSGRDDFIDKAWGKDRHYQVNQMSSSSEKCHRFLSMV